MLLLVVHFVPHRQRVGDKTPADLILFATTDLKVDNSSLTGESEPQERHPVPEGSKHRPVEAENMASTPLVSSLSPSYFKTRFSTPRSSSTVKDGEVRLLINNSSSSLIVVLSGCQDRRPHSHW